MIIKLAKQEQIPKMYYKGSLKLNIAKLSQFFTE